eukprot:TRINITY_DN61480_c0_g1_i1.p1 TRINITY_DN61480_c0_g1~~TRINITY_DN61480_c0_g1_i1.p1  ORF type:complete len:350 (-),score=62.36 TRINITY_DN61480_c0_g1_i1:59-1108(-)
MSRFCYSLQLNILSFFFFFFLMIRRPPRSTLSSSSAASDVYKRQISTSPLLDKPFSLSPSSITSPTTPSSKSVAYVSGSIGHRISYELVDAPDDFRRGTALPLPINCEALASYIRGRRMLVSELQRLTIRDPKVLLKDGYAVPVTPDDRRAKCVVREAVFTKLQHIVKTSGITGLQALRPIGKFSGSNQPHYLTPIITRANRSMNSTNNKRPQSATLHNSHHNDLSSASAGGPATMTSSGNYHSSSGYNNNNGPTLITADVELGLSALMVSMGNTFITTECTHIKGRQLAALTDNATRHKGPLISFEGGRIDTTTSSSLMEAVSYTHPRAHETPEHLVCRLLLEKKKNP